MNTITNLTQKKTALIAQATELVTRTGLKSKTDKDAHLKLLAEIDDTQEHIDMLSRIERSLPAPVPPTPHQWQPQPSSLLKKHQSGARPVCQLPIVIF